MKTTIIPFLSVLLFFANCLKNDKNLEAFENENTSSEEVQTKSTLRGYYPKLYALDNQCKMTAEEVANLFEVTSEKVEEKFISTSSTTGGSYCSYTVDINNGQLVDFSVIASEKSQGEVKKEIKLWQTGEYEKNL